MTTAAASLSVDVSANLAKLFEGLTQATSAVNRSAETMKTQFEGVNKSLASLVDSFTSLHGVVTGLAGALGIGAFAGLITSAIEGEAELYRLSQRTGATVESLSAMRVAARLTGVDIEQVAIGISRFAKNITDAEAGTGKAGKALQGLGFDAKTFSTQFASTDQALLAVAKRMNEFGDEQTKTAYAMTLFGRAGQQLIPFLRQIAEQGLASTIVTRAQAQAAEELERSWTKLGGQVRVFAINLANTLIPILQALVENLDTVKNYAIAAIGIFVVWPLTLKLVAGAVGLVEAAWIAYREAAIGAALANEVLGASTSTFDILGVKILDSLAKLVTLKGLLIGIPAIIFAAFAGFKIGDWLQANVIDVKLFGIEMVEVFLLSWENIKYAGQVTWELLKLGFFGLVNTLRDIFGTFISTIGEGLSLVPGMVGDAGVGLISLGNALKGSSSATADFDKNIAKLTADNEKAKKGIVDITGDLKAFAIAENLFGKQVAAPPKLPTLSAFPVDDKKVHDATESMNAYAKAIAAAAKVANEALASITAEGIKLEEAELDRSYSRGLITFAQFWDQKLALQKTKQANQEQLLAANVNEQETLVASLNASLDNLVDSKSDFASKNKLDEYYKALRKTMGDLETATGNLTKARAALTVEEMKGTEIGKNYLEELIKANAGVLSGVQALDKNIEAAQREVDAIGLTKDQIILLNVARIENIKQMQIQAGTATAEVLKGLDDEIEKTKQLAAVAAQGIAKQQWVQGWTDLFKSAADEGAKFIEDFAQHGSSAFKNLWNDFKTWALEAIAKIAAQQIILSITGNISGLSGIASNALQGAGGPVGNILGGLGGGAGGGLGNIGSAIGSIFGSGGVGLGTAVENLSTIIPTFTTLLETGATVTEAASAAFAGMAASFAAVVPVVGLVAAAAILTYNYLESKKGGPKEAGFATSGVDRSSYFPTEETAGADAVAQKLVDSLSTSFNDALQKLGGKALNIGFALGFDTDPQGKAPSNVHGGVFKGGQSIYENPNANVGRDPAAVQAELEHQAQQMLLVALQASDLPAAISHVLNSVVAATASDTDISAVIDLANNVKGVIDTLAEAVPSKIAAITTAIEGIDFTNVKDKLRAVFSAAFGQIDPALATLVDQFQGTDAEVQTFGNTLLTIYDTTSKISALKFPTPAQATGWLDKVASTLTSGYVPGAGLSATHTSTAQGAAGGGGLPPEVVDYQKAIDAVLDGTQETADKVLVFVQALLAFGDGINGVGVDLHNLDPKYITAFIDALGGAQKAAAAFTYLQANFLTGADKAAKAQADLTKSFADLGLAVPATHQAFLALLDSFDLTTDAGRALYASVIALAPAFIDVAGTADQAAKALQSAADFFAQNFYSETEKNTAKLASETAALDAAQAQLGISIPRTVEGFRALIESIDRTTPAGEAMYEALIVLAPAILDVSKGLSGLATAAGTAAQQVQEIITNLGGFDDFTGADSAQQYIDRIKALADAIPNAGFGDKLAFEIDMIKKEIAFALKEMNDPNLDQATRDAYELIAARLGYSNQQMIAELAEFTVLSAQYGDATAEQLISLEDWYKQQKEIFFGNADALAALDKIFKEKWDAIIKGIADGVGGSIDQLTKLKQAIADYLKGLQLSDLSPLTPAQKLAEAQKQYLDELALAAKGDPTALADITKYADAYLKQARDFYASSDAYAAIFKQITDALAALAGTDAQGNPTGHHDFKGAGGLGSGVSANDLNNALFHSLPDHGHQLASADDIAFATKALSKVINDAIAALAESNRDDSRNVQNEVDRARTHIVDSMGRNLK